MSNEANRVSHSPPDAYVQIYTDRCLVCWDDEGRFMSRVIPSRDLIAFVAKLESDDCYNIDWSEEGY